MTAAVPDPRFRDQLAEALRSHRNLGIREGEWTCACGRQFPVLDGWLTHRADALLPLIEARVQAAAAQRAAEVIGRVKAVPTYVLTNDDQPLGTVVIADDVLDALAQPADGATPPLEGGDQ